MGDPRDGGKSKIDDFLSGRISFGYINSTANNTYKLPNNLDLNTSDLPKTSTFQNYNINISSNKYDPTIHGPTRGELGFFTQTNYFFGNSLNQVKDDKEFNFINTKGVSQLVGVDMIANFITVKMGVGPAVYSISGTQQNIETGEKNNIKGTKIGVGATGEFQFPLSDVVLAVANGGRENSKLHFNFSIKYDGVWAVGRAPQNPSYSNIGYQGELAFDFSDDKRSHLRLYAGQGDIFSIGQKGGSSYSPTDRALSFGATLSLPFDVKIHSTPKTKHERIEHSASPGSELKPFTKEKDLDVKTPRGSSTEQSQESPLKYASLETILAEKESFTKGERVRVNLIIDSLKQAGIDYKGNGKDLDENQTKIFNTARAAILTLSDEGEQLYSSKANAKKSAEFTKATEQLKNAFKEAGVTLSGDLKGLNLSKLNTPEFREGYVKPQSNAFEKK